MDIDSFNSDNDYVVSLTNNQLYLAGAVLILIIVLLIIVRRELLIQRRDNKGIIKDRQVQQRIIEDLKKQVTKHRTNSKPEANPKNIFDYSMSSILIASPGGDLQDVNPGFVKMFGFTKEEYIANYGSDLIASSVYPNAIEEAIETKRSVIFPSYRYNAKKEQIWLNVEVCPVLNSNDEIEKLIFIETDVSLFKDVENEIIKQREVVEYEKIRAEMQRDNMQHKFKGFADSVAYARKIQNAMLPSESMLEEMFSEYFILNKPRDVVSGDFYWTARKGNQKLVVVADCTGHGVPGAFMSILGITFLNDIIARQRKLSAATILNKLRDVVVQALARESKEEDPQDGIDLGLCIIDEERNVMQYAGANNSLYLIREGSLQIYKGNRMPVGLHPRMKESFTNNEVTLKKGDALYLFTDGYLDQFGWRNGKKFKAKPFQDQLMQLQEIPMKGQRIILENTINNWKGDLEQVDDILVMGIKF